MERPTCWTRCIGLSNEAIARTILAIDTTSGNGSLALANAIEVIEEITLPSADGYGHILFDAIDGLLSRHQIAIHQLSAIAVASGPGTFTGVRFGVTAAKGLAEAAGLRVVTVSNLAAMAWFGSAPLRAVAIDARRGEVYGAVYDAALNPVVEERVVLLATWLAALPAGDVDLIGDIAGATALPIPQALAGAIACISLARFSTARDPVEVDANYVRRTNAELSLKEA